MDGSTTRRLGNNAGMAHIYIYSPSGAVVDKAAFRRAVQCLKRLGHEVEVDADALSRQTRFAGDDETRLNAIRRACASGASVAMVSRGGYGLSRLLPQLPYKELDKAVAKGTRFVGLSDFTALQLALLAQKGSETWAGPAVCEGFGSEQGPDDITQACFEDMVSGVSEGAGWRLSAGDFKAHPQLAAEGGWGVDKVTLWGGNLTVLTSLLGTPYFPQIKRGVLFLEDVNEHPYRIERMFSQLLHAGVLAQQKAILLGRFTDYKPSPIDKGYKLQSAIDWLRSQVKVPVLTGLPFGHVPTKVLLPVGKTIELMVHQRDAIAYWD